MCLVHKRAVRQITKYLVSTSTYIDLPGGNRRLIKYGIVYKTNIEKGINCYVDADFAGEWAQADSYNEENLMLRMVYVITYTVYPVLWCSKLL